MKFGLLVIAASNILIAVNVGTSAMSSLCTTIVRVPKPPARAPKLNPDREARSAVKLHYNYVGAYTYAYNLTIENTDNHRSLALVIRTPNFEDHLHPRVRRYVIGPRETVPVCHVIFPGCASVLSARLE